MRARSIASLALLCKAVAPALAAHVLASACPAPGPPPPPAPGGHALTGGRFQEYGPPFDPGHPTIPYARLNTLLSVRRQWVCCGCIWAVLLFWAPTYYFDIFKSDGLIVVGGRSYDFKLAGALRHANNILPVLVLFVLAYPMGYGLLGWTPPAVGFLALALHLALPFACAHFKVLIPYLSGLAGSVIVFFAWLSIHGSGMTNAPHNEAFWWVWVVGVPPALGLVNAAMYAWQHRAERWSISPQFRFIMEGTLFGLYALEVLVPFSLEVTGLNRYDPSVLRVYNLNDVQYIRLNTMRVCLFITANYGVARAIEYLIYFELDKYKTEWESTHGTARASSAA